MFCLYKGLLRQVPLVGSFVNWLSPLPEEPKTIGRTFNLTSGKSLLLDCVLGPLRSAQKHLLTGPKGNSDFYFP